MSSSPLPASFRVAVLDDYQRVARSLAAWDTLGPGVEVEFFHDHVADARALVQRLSAFDAIVAMRERTPFPRAVLAELPRLRLLVTTGARNAAIDVAAARELGVVVSGTGGLPYPTAELTWGLLLALARNIPREDRAVRAGEWQTSLGLGLSGKTLGLLGLGRLGAQVARVALAFGMRVTAYSQNLTPERAAEHGATLLPLDELLSGADVVSIHLVLSERTRGLLGARELGLLKPGALLVNTSRGPIVDERALIEALTSGRLAGAALDVFDTEPLPAEHPLRRLPNTVITPHLGYVTEETYRIFYGDALEDIAAFRAGQPVRVL
ncbi:hydroxyacid dehydrogenase [Sorangium cellulosum]|uniref:Hydroxyacid dehydrogenase n=1 Tax=Sorangium cellulosum TaxID=56 RepID=A0A150R2P5_SORCE|nr:hydroxyacid dehydrogenase [Sorangium cellulosum]